jgi:hypothetical protein
MRVGPIPTPANVPGTGGRPPGGDHQRCERKTQGDQDHVGFFVLDSLANRRAVEIQVVDANTDGRESAALVGALLRLRNTEDDFCIRFPVEDSSAPPEDAGHGRGGKNEDPCVSSLGRHH